MRSRANVRWLGAAGLLLACLVALPGQAGADDPPPTISVNDARPRKAERSTSRSRSPSRRPTADGERRCRRQTSSAAGYTSAQRDGHVRGRPDVEQDFDVATRRERSRRARRHVHRHPLETSDDATIADGHGRRHDHRRRRDAHASRSAAPPTVARGRHCGVHRHDDRQVGIRPVTVNYATANGTGPRRPTRDYDAESGQLTWAARRDGREVLRRPDPEDTLDENDETFTVNLSAARTDANHDRHRRRRRSPTTTPRRRSGDRRRRGDRRERDRRLLVTSPLGAQREEHHDHLRCPAKAARRPRGRLRAERHATVLRPATTSRSRPSSIKVKGDTLFEGDETVSRQPLRRRVERGPGAGRAAAK